MQKFLPCGTAVLLGLCFRNSTTAAALSNLGGLGACAQLAMALFEQEQANSTQCSLGPRTSTIILHAGLPLPGEAGKMHGQMGELPLCFFFQ